MEIDFKDIENRIELCKYLDPLIDDFIATNTLHLSLIQFKKHFDYMMIYLTHKYSRITADINQIFKAFNLNDYDKVNSWNKSQWDLFHSKLKSQPEYLTCKSLYDLVNMYAYLLIPIEIKIRNPSMSKAGKIKGHGYIYIQFKYLAWTYEYARHIHFIKRELFDNLPKIGDLCRETAYKDGRYNFIKLTVATKSEDDYINKFKTKRDEIITFLQKSHFKVNVKED